MYGFYGSLKSALWLLLALLLLPALAQAKSSLPAGTLTSEELKGLFFYTTVEVDSLKAKDQIVLYFSPKGDISKVVDGRLRKGRWKVKENGRLCTKLDRKDWSCRIVVKGDVDYRQYVVKKDGQHKHELTYRKFHPGKKMAELSPAPLLPEGTLDRKQLKKLFADKTVESITAKQGRISQTYYGPDGAVIQFRNDQQRHGKWRVTKQGRICLQMEDLKEKCRIIVEEDGVYKKYIVKKNGRHLHSVSYRDFISGKQF
jgi:hypothetical protein